MKKILHTCVRFRAPSETDNDSGGQEHMNGTADELIAYFEVNGTSDDWPTTRDAFKRKRFNFNESLSIYLYYFQDLSEAELEAAYKSKLGYFQWELEQMNLDELPEVYYQIENYFGELKPGRSS